MSAIGMTDDDACEALWVLSMRHGKQWQVEAISPLQKLESIALTLPQNQTQKVERLGGMTPRRRTSLLWFAKLHGRLTV